MHPSVKFQICSWLFALAILAIPFCFITAIFTGEWRFLLGMIPGVLVIMSALHS